MSRIATYIKQRMDALKGLLVMRIDLFPFLLGVLPPVFFADVNYVPFLKKIPLFLLIALVIISFVVTSMPHIFLT